MTTAFIAILGGSFDPIHNGHLELAKMITQAIKNTAIHFVPCGQPVHRAPSSVTAEHRLNMVRLAIESHTDWQLNTYEIDSPEPSYTLNTLRYFRQKFPDTSMSFIMGMDSFLKIETWGNWQALLDYAHLLIVPRQGYHSAQLTPLIGNENLLHKSLNGCIMTLPMAPQSISSTEIRKKIAAHEDVSSLIPKAVYDYIQQHKLYL